MPFTAKNEDNIIVMVFLPPEYCRFLLKKGLQRDGGEGFTGTQDPLATLLADCIVIFLALSQKTCQTCCVRKWCRLPQIVYLKRVMKQDMTPKEEEILNCTFSIGNRTISSTIWKLIDTSNVLKVLVIARADRRVQFKNFQNITRVY